MISVYRLAADFLTLLRVILSAALVWIGLTEGAEGLTTAVAILLFAWFSDILDGPLARRAPSSEPSWIGAHDAEADMTMSLGVLGFLAFSVLLDARLAIGLGVVIIVLWFISYPLAWPFYALPYVFLLRVTWQRSPTASLGILLYIGMALLARFGRMRHEYLPLFFENLARVWNRIRPH